jgi:hypothetical protein
MRRSSLEEALKLHAGLLSLRTTGLTWMERAQALSEAASRFQQPELLPRKECAMPLANARLA